jgi:arylsulfatase A-like enzyme
MKATGFLVAALAMAWLLPAIDAAEISKPNLVVILIDDMGYGDIGPFGSKVNRTPHLDRMAREGMKLTSFYGAPVCTPSRAQMMTGCYAKRVSLPDVIYPACAIGISSKERTVAELLREQGYATVAIGKWHLGDQPCFLPTRHGFDHYLGLPYSNDMGRGGNKDDKRPPLPLLRDGDVIEAPADQDRLTARYTEEAVKFIRDNQRRPFFLYLPHTAVHVPLHPGAAFKGKSANGAYGDWVEEVDWSVGRVLDALRELKLAERTFVLFTSDNGPWLTQGRNGGVAGPLHGGKGTTWEGGVREPTIAWWPGRIAPGASCDTAMSNTDVLPTLVGLAGGKVPADRKIDGRDIWPLLAGKTRKSPHEALYYFNSNQLQAVRSGAWKLAIAPQATGLPLGKAEPVKHTGPRLYNLDSDIGETRDVAAQHPDVVARLQEFIHQMDGDLGAKGIGPGVRPPDRVQNPQPLLKRVATEYD